jgi:hypothetical protein
MSSHDPAETRTRDSIEKTIAFVRLGFHDVSLNFTVRLGATDHLADVFNACGPYNDFEPEAAFIALAPIFPKVSAVEFGRESTPIIAFEVPYWDHQRIGYTGPRMSSHLTNDQRHETAAAAAAALEQAGVSRVRYHLVTSTEEDYLRRIAGRDLSGVGVTVRGEWH